MVVWGLFLCFLNYSTHLPVQGPSHSSLAQTWHPTFHHFPFPTTVTSLILYSPPRIFLALQALGKLSPKPAVPTWGSLSHLPIALLLSLSPAVLYAGPQCRFTALPACGVMGPRPPFPMKQCGKVRNQKGARGSSPSTHSTV